MAYIPSSGSVVAFQSSPTALVGTVSVVGVLSPTSVSGVGTFNINPVGSGSVVATLETSSVTTLQGTNPWVVGNSSVKVVGVVPTTSVIVVPGIGVLGSVATLQGTDPWRVITPGSVVTVWKDSSVLAGLTATNASVITLVQGTNSVLTINEVTRNDAVASFLGVDLTTRYMASDSAGRILLKPFAANESSIFGVTSTVNSGDAASVLLIAGAGAGLKNYITDYQVSNTGPTTTLVTFTEGGASIIGRTIAPTGGGSNMPGMMWPISNVVPNQPINMVVATASSTVHISFRGFKAP